MMGEKTGSAFLIGGSFPGFRSLLDSPHRRTDLEIAD
jgi:hypothetical protein